MIRRIAALIWLSSRMPLRSRLVWGLLVVLAVVLVGIRGDGTPEGEVRMLLTWSLGLATGVLGVAALWSGCSALATDIETGRFVQTAVSPVRPFELLMGRWLGLVLVYSVLLAVAVGLAGIQLPLRGIPKTAWKVERVLELDADYLDEQVEHLYTMAEQQGLIPEDQRRSDVLQQIRKDYLTEYFSLEPGQSRRWRLRVPNKPEETTPELTLRFQFLSAFGIAAGCEGRLRVLDLEAGLVLEQVITEHDKGGIVVNVPARQWAERCVCVEFVNEATTEGASVLVQHGESVRATIPGGPFWVNLVKSGLVMVAVVALLAAVGLACGSLFSFPVATFVATTLVVITVIGQSEVLDESLEAGHTHGKTQEATWQWGQAALETFSRAVSDGITVLVKPLAEAAPLDRLGDSLAIPMRTVWRTLFLLVF